MNIKERISTVVESGVVTWKKLSDETGWSATALSQWKNGKYPGDTAALETKLEEWLAIHTAPALTGTDARTLTRILVLLDDADNATAIRSALLRFGV